MRYWAFYYLWFAFRFRPETGDRARILAGYPGSVSPELQDVNKMAAIVTIMSLAGDPFCGSGTIGIACLLLGRNYVGFEQDEGAARRGGAKTGGDCRSNGRSNGVKA